MYIGHRIKQRREELGISQEELARRMGYKNRSTIAKIEGEVNDLSQSKVRAFAQVLDTTPAYLMGWEGASPAQEPTTGAVIPVRGRVAAGLPITAVEEVIDYEEIPQKMALSGEYIALKIKGDSMEPKMSEGDVVIVRLQPDVENGETAVVLVNGDDATVKKVKKIPGGLLLVPNNPTYDPIFYSYEEIEQLPVEIVGKVVELRAKF